MAAPNNKVHIERALQKLRDAGVNLVVPNSQFEQTRARCLPYIWDEFPDKASWRLMRKTEKSLSHVQPDILWYLPTGEHFDVSTSDDHDDDPRIPVEHSRVKAAWKNQGINDRQTRGIWIPITTQQANLEPFDVAGHDDVHNDVPQHNDAPAHDDAPAPNQLLEVLSRIEFRMESIDANLTLINARLDDLDNGEDVARLIATALTKLDRAYVGRIFGATFRLTPEG